MTAREILLDTAADDLDAVAQLVALASVELRQASKARPNDAEAMRAAADAVLAQSQQLSIAAMSARAVGERLHCVAVFEEG